MLSREGDVGAWVLLWSLKLREKRRLRVFENGVLGGTR